MVVLWALSAVVGHIVEDCYDLEWSMVHLADYFNYEAFFERQSGNPMTDASCSCTITRWARTITCSATSYPVPPFLPPRAFPKAKALLAFNQYSIYFNRHPHRHLKNWEDLHMDNMTYLNYALKYYHNHRHP